MITDVSKALETAVGHHQAGRLVEAEEIYRRILAAEPGCAQAWHFLGVMANQVGQPALAVEQIGRSLELQEADPQAHNHLGLAYQALKKPIEAIASYRRALALQPNFFEAHYNCGNAFRDFGQLTEAVSCYRRALALNPELFEAYNNLGAVLRNQGAQGEAADCYRQALRIKPDDAEVHFNLGLVTQDQGKPEEAIACYWRASELQPDMAEAHNNLGALVGDQGELDEANQCFERALKLKPDYAEAHNNRGKVFYENCNWEAAAACFERALQLNPAYAEAWSSLGVVLRYQRKLADADGCYSRALELKPDLADAHINKSFQLLLTGDLERGWQEYEWRWKTKRFPPRDFRQPVWSGQSLGGLTILLHAEQGLGDTLQFIRYAPLVKRFGGRVLVECQKALWKLLARCPGIDRLIVAGEQLPPFDVHAPLQSLPGIFNTSMASIPANVPYVFADEALVALWRDRLDTGQRFRIGINWRGRPGRGHWRDRDMPLEGFAALSRVPNVELVSLQKGEGRKELAGAGFPIFDPGDDVDTVHGGFMDTAAIMKNLDLVITSDTSVPHLAGALAVPVWLALPFVPDWRWLLDRGDSPWYPTMRLFRQERAGDWASVFDGMLRALQELRRS